MIFKSVLYINMCVKKFKIQPLSCYMLGKIDSIQERELLMPVDTDWVSAVWLFLWIEEHTSTKPRKETSDNLKYEYYLHKTCTR